MDVHGTYGIMDMHALNKSQLNFTLEHYWVTRLDLFVKKSFLDLERAQNIGALVFNGLWVLGSGRARAFQNLAYISLSFWTFAFKAFVEAYS